MIRAFLKSIYIIEDRKGYPNDVIKNSHGDEVFKINGQVKNDIEHFALNRFENKEYIVEMHLKKNSSAIN